LSKLIDYVDNTYIFAIIYIYNGVLKYLSRWSIFLIRGKSVLFYWNSDDNFSTF